MQPATCPNCQGSGRRPLPRGMSAGFYAFMVPGCRDEWPPRMICPACEGTGKRKADKQPGTAAVGPGGGG